MSDTIVLPIKKVWFDKIRAGIKKEEYRGLTYYWFKRLCTNPEQRYSSIIGCRPNQEDLEYRNKSVKDLVTSKWFTWEGERTPFKDYKKVELRNGYGNSVPTIIVELLGVKVDEGLQEWGAEKGERYFVLQLGKILEQKNIKQ